MNSTSPLAMGLVMVAIFIAGLLLGRMSATIDMIPGTTDGTRTVSEETAGETESPALSDTSATSGTGTVVNTTSLTPSQRTMLKTFGIDADNITLTPQMIACAEASVGKERAEQIKNGATPSMTEGIKLVACYK